jgi:outer membrane protein assembly factor BamA
LLPGGVLSSNRASVQLAWEATTAHTYGYSISPENGVVAGATAELVRRGLGASADATIVTTDVRAYLPGIGTHHVIAARLAAGSSTGDPIVGRTFLLGGAFAEASVIDFGSGAIHLLRGFPANSFAGSHVALTNVDYRFPIARPQRGVGTWPLFVHTVHAAVFADVGNAWTSSFDARAIKTSTGAELSTDVIVGYYFPFTVGAGAAWGHGGSSAIASGLTAYLRVGKAF